MTTAGQGLRARRGVTMIELIVALSIIAIGVLALSGSATLVTRLTGGGTVQTRAALIANAHIEQFRATACANVTGGTDTVRSVISSWTANSVTVNGTRRGMSINLTVQYPTTKGMRSAVYTTLLTC
jgi:prepilin-type N-terminal cleavage/methylation domain-containing protein